MPGILERIDSPAKLKELAYQELEQLAAEIRTDLVNRVHLNGGHLASNLGVVELTISELSIQTSIKQREAVSQ